MYSGKDNGAVADPNSVADDDVAAAVGEVRGLWVVPEVENGGFWANGNVAACADLKLAPIKQAAEVDHIALAKMNFAGVEELTAHLDPGSFSHGSQVTAKESLPDPPRRAVAQPVVVAVGQEGTRDEPFIHGDFRR